MAKAKTLFTVNIGHDYYDGGMLNDFKIVPTRETSTVLRNHNMFFRTTNTGFRVASLTEEPTQDQFTIQLPPKAPGRLQFMLMARKPHFSIYTDLPIHQVRDSIYYFSNLHSNIADGDKLLHASGNKVSASEQIALESGIYYYQHNGTDETISAELKFPDIGISEKKMVPNNEGVFQFYFQLTDFPIGRAELEIEGSKVDSFYSVNMREASTLYGMIEIFYSQEVPETYQFMDESGTVTQQNYNICFKNRETFWKYIVINESSIELDDPGILHESFSFSEQLSDQYPANYKVFVSEQQIPLSNESKGTFSLIRNMSSDRRVVVDPLPNPGSKDLRRDEHDLNKFYSEIFLYI